MQNEGHFGLKTGFKPAATLVLGQKPIGSLRRPSFCTKNGIEACGEGHFGLKTDLKPAARVISRYPCRGELHSPPLDGPRGAE